MWSESSWCLVGNPISGTSISQGRRQISFATVDQDHNNSFSHCFTHGILMANAFIRFLSESQLNATLENNPLPFTLDTLWTERICKLFIPLTDDCCNWITMDATSQLQLLLGFNPSLKRNTITTYKLMLLLLCRYDHRFNDYLYRIKTRWRPLMMTSEHYTILLYGLRVDLAATHDPFTIYYILQLYSGRQTNNNCTRCTLSICTHSLYISLIKFLPPNLMTRHQCAHTIDDRMETRIR